MANGHLTESERQELHRAIKAAWMSTDPGFAQREGMIASQTADAFLPEIEKAVEIILARRAGGNAKNG